MDQQAGTFYRLLIIMTGIIERINKVVVFLGALLIALMALATLVDAIGRYVAVPVHGVHELSELMIVFATFIVFGAVQHTRSHIDVEVFYQHFSESVKRAVDTFTLLICFLMCLAATWGTYTMMTKSWAKMEYDAGYVSFPLYPAKTVIFIGMGYLAFILLVQLAGRISEYFGVPSIQRVSESTIDYDDQTEV